MKRDHQWLNQYAELLRDKTILELGCGTGIDTQALSRWAKSLLACDINPALDSTSIAAANTTIMTVDHSAPMLFETGKFDVIIASLCLHYFSWQRTETIVAELARLLTPTGLLICRLNTDRDIHYGASGHRELEPGLFEVHGASKRFFSRADVIGLFRQHWQLDELTLASIDRYEKAKSVWTLRARYLSS